MTRLAGFLLASTLLVSVLYGCDADRIRRDFISTRYLQQAQADLTRLPRDIAGAQHALDRAVALRPNDQQLRRQAAALYVSAHAYAKSAALYAQLPDLIPDERALYGYSLLRAGDRERGARMCVEVIRTADEQQKRGTMPRRQWAALLNEAGYLLLDANAELEAASDAVGRATEAYPLEAAFVDSLGWAMFRRGKFTEAAFYLERAARLSPVDDPEMEYHLGVVYARLGRIADAERALERARELDPSLDDSVEKELRGLGRILPPPALAALPGRAVL